MADVILSEQMIAQAGISTGPMLLLLYWLGQKLDRLEKKLDDVVEGIAYWGKRKEGDVKVGT